jgi:microcystin-dependent protein
MVWTKSISEIPSGWAICDGNNGTPDLIDRMVRGVSPTNDSAGVRGGTNSTVLATSQIPSHNHPVTIDSTQVGDHTHELGQTDNRWGIDPSDYTTTPGAQYDSYPTTSAGNHSHEFSVGATGSDSPIENRPKQKKVIYIMKL